MREEIQLKLHTDKTEYLLGEPVVAYIEVSNIGTQSRSLSNQLDPEYEIVKFFIKNGDKENLFRPSVVLDSLFRTSLIKPGDSMNAAAKIFYGGKGWTFNSTGKYQIRATYHGLVDISNEVQSNIAEVNIRSPMNVEEKEQVNLIMGAEQGLFLLFEQGDHLINGMNSLAKLTDKFPQSDLAGYANLALGKNYSTDFKDFQKGRVRKAEINKSIAHLKSAKDKEIGSYFKRQAFLTLTSVFRRSNNIAAAKETLNEFIQIFSGDIRNSDSINKAKTILNELS